MHVYQNDVLLIVEDGMSFETVQLALRVYMYLTCTYISAVIKTIVSGRWYGYSLVHLLRHRLCELRVCNCLVNYA